MNRRRYSEYVGTAIAVIVMIAEAYLRNYYNLLNFGGTAHKQTERA